MKFPIIKSDVKKSKRVAVILAAGKGTRMNDPVRNKVCYPVGGIPVVNRIIQTCKHSGLKDIFVAVGFRYQDVIATIEKDHHDINYVYQKNQIGTADAVRCACECLKALGFAGEILIIAGDKLVSPSFLLKMREFFEENNQDLLFATSKLHSGKFGKVLRDDSGKILSIVEAKNFEILKKTENYKLLDLLEKSQETNQSIYFVKAGVLYQALEEIEKDSVSGEEYFTDIVSIFSRKNLKVETFEIANKYDVLTFNTPQEYLEVEMYFQQVKVKTLENKLKNDKNYKNVLEWIRIFEEKPAALVAFLKEIYRDESAVIDSKIKIYLRVLHKFAENFGAERKVFIVRSPGRLNIMGRHIDHRGGAVNIMAIDKEIIMVVEPRSDDRVMLHNVDEQKFPCREFSITEEMSKLDWSSWVNSINSQLLKEELNKNAGDWVNYVKAACLKIQDTFRERRIVGMNALVLGDVPIGSGLSSSSAMVVASAEALILANDIIFTPESFVKLCGEAEWFVGTRGGFGDHAAIKFGLKGNISQIKFLEFEFLGSAPLPEPYSIVFCYSQEEAKKAENARNVFNQKIACYEIGTLLLKKLHPELSAKINHLRDVNPESLNIPEYEVYQMLKALPERITREELISFLGKERKLENIFSTHSPPFEGYPLRGVCFFGISECARSKLCLELLEKEDIKTLGELMTISHNGDRVTVLNEYGERVTYMSDVSTDYLNRLIEGRKRINNKKFTLAYQSGWYGCSTYKVDTLVDIASSVEGVFGAQIAGAGLGGCVMVLCLKEKIEKLKKQLIKNYYQHYNLVPLIEEAIPVKGSGWIEINNY